MSRYAVARPNQEVRLRKWPPGRVAQLKLFLSHLETTINSSLAAQVSQTPSRKFSEFVPIIPNQNISGTVEYREIRIEFTPPKGLRDFLFYEYQISTTSNFSNFDGFVSADPNFVFGSLADAATYFIRVRVVTKRGLVGPWSATFTGTTPAAQSIQTSDGTEYTYDVFVGDFQELFTIEHEALGGEAYYSIQYEVESIENTDEQNAIFWSDAEFRWKIDGKQQGQNMLITAYGGKTGVGSVTDLEAHVNEIGSFLDINPDTTDTNVLRIPLPFSVIRRGTFVQKIDVLETGTKTISMEGRVLAPEVHTTPNDYQFSASIGSNIVYGRRCQISLKNFTLFEVTAGAV